MPADASELEGIAAMLTVFGSTLAVALAFTTWLSRATGGRRSAVQRAPFLGGSEPETHAFSRFHVRYYPMVLVLVAFEMEMMFMYPWAVVFVREGGKALAEMGMFLTMLAVGLLYAWREGALRWQ